MLVPAAELARLSHRPGLGFETFTSFDLPLAELPQLVFPLLFGGPLDYFGTWNLTETSGYLGFVAWGAALVAVLGGGRRVVWFWAGAAIVGLLLALGDATPLAAAAYRLPVFRLFRCPARHLMETTIAVSVLAGLGAAELERQAGEGARLGRGVALATLLAAVALALLAVAAYEPVTRGEPPPLGVAAASRGALVLPLLFAAAAAAALIVFSRAPARVAAAGLLLVVAALELGSLGRLVEWRAQAPRAGVERIPARLGEYRERLKRSGQRAVSFYGDGVAAAMPNLGWLWDLPHAAAYMALVVGRANELVPFTGSDALYCDDNQALDLFAARYLFAPRRERGGFEWGPGSSLACGDPARGAREWRAPDRWATSVALAGALANSVEVADGQRVGELRVTTVEGDVLSLPIRAGDHLSEWAYERRDVRPVVRHRRARLFERTAAVDERGRRFAAQRYLAVFDLGARLRLARIEVAGDAGAVLLVDRVSLRDDRDGESHPLFPGRGSVGCWRLVETAERAGVYENRRALPRAWFVGEVLPMEAGAIRRAIESSRLPDGRRFDARRTALVEEAVDFRPPPATAAARVEIIAGEGGRLELATQGDAESFLVLADVHYPGWRAAIDGETTPIHRTDYALRGVVVPAGRHRVLFEFHPRSLYLGLVLSAASLVLLASYRFR